jgi:hypothetical protein
MTRCEKEGTLCLHDTVVFEFTDDQFDSRTESLSLDLG